MQAVLAAVRSPPPLTPGPEGARDLISQFTARSGPLALKVLICLDTWLDPTVESQQDACEFLLHALRQLKMAGTSSRWIARVRAPLGWDTTDSASGVLSLFLQLPEQDVPVTLQALIDEWQDQRASHCFTLLPRLLVLQLARFTGVHTRLSTPLDLTQGEFFLPAEDRLQHYVVRSWVLHQGLRSTTGHYRALLVSETPGQPALLVDDHRQSPLVDVTAASSDVYLALARAV